MHLFQSVNSHFEGDSIDAKRQAFIYLMAAKHHVALTSCNWYMALKYCRGNLPVAKEMAAIGELPIDWPSASLLVWLGLCCAERVRSKDEHAADPALARTLPLEHRYRLHVVGLLQIFVQLAWLFLLWLDRCRRHGCFVSMISLRKKWN